MGGNLLQQYGYGAPAAPQSSTPAAAPSSPSASPSAHGADSPSSLLSQFGYGKPSAAGGSLLSQFGYGGGNAVAPSRSIAEIGSVSGENASLGRQLQQAGATPAQKQPNFLSRVFHAASVPIGKAASAVNQGLIQEHQETRGNPFGAITHIGALPGALRQGVQQYNQGHPVTFSDVLAQEGVPSDIRFNLPSFLRGPVESAAGPIPVDIKRETLGAFGQGFENPLSYGETFRAGGAAARAVGLPAAAKAVGEAALESPVGKQIAGMFSNTAGVPQALVRLGEGFKSAKNETLRTVQPILNKLESSFKGPAKDRNAAKAEMALSLSQDQSLESSLGGLPRNTMVRIISKALKMKPEDVASLPHSDLEDMTRQAFSELSQELHARGQAEEARKILRSKVGGPPVSEAVQKTASHGPELDALQRAVEQHAGEPVNIKNLTDQDFNTIAKSALTEHFEPAAHDSGQQAHQAAQDALQQAFSRIKPDVDRNFLVEALGPEKKHLIREQLRQMPQPEIDALVKDAVAQQAANGGESYADVARRMAEARGINLDKLISDAGKPVEEWSADALQRMVLEVMVGAKDAPEDIKPIVHAATIGKAGIAATAQERQQLLSRLAGAAKGEVQQRKELLGRLAGGIKNVAKQGIAEAPKGKPNPKLLAEARALVRQATGAKTSEVRALAPQDLADLLNEASSALKSAHPVASLPTAERYAELARQVEGVPGEGVYRKVANLLPAVEAGKTVEYAPRTGYFHHVYESAKPFQRVPSFLRPEAAAIRSSAAGYTKRPGFTKEQVLNDLRLAQEYAQTHGMKLVTDPVKSLAHRLERSVHATHVQDLLDSVKRLADTEDGKGIISRIEHAPLGFQQLPEVAQLKGYAVSPDAARYIRSLVAPKPGDSPIEKVFDSILGAIRQGIFYTPGPHGLVNLPQNAFVAGFNIFNPQNWPLAFAAVKELSAEGPVFRALRRAGAYLDNFGNASSLAHEAARSAGHVPVLEKINILRKLHDVTWALDKFWRTALGMRLIQNGSSVEDAAKKVRQALGYPDLTEFERQILSRVFLAYPWMKGNLVFQAISHATSPGRVQTIRSLADSINAQATGHPRAENPPGYEAGVVLPISNQKGQNLAVKHIPGPAKDFEELIQGGPAGFIENRLTPPVRFAAQEATGKMSPFNPSDTRPLNPPGASVPLFGYGQTGFGPQVSPGQQAAAGVFGLPQTIGENLHASSGQRVGSLFGVYPQPLDTTKLTLQQVLDENQLLKEQIAQLNAQGIRVGSHLPKPKTG